MPERSRVEAFIAEVVHGDHVTAIAEQVAEKQKQVNKPISWKFLAFGSDWNT